jgi:hypothetical protein
MGIQWKTAAEIAASTGAVPPAPAAPAKPAPAAPAAPKKVSPLKGTKKAVLDPGVVVEAAPAVAVHKPKLVGKTVVTDEMKMVDELVTLDAFLVKHEVDAKLKRVAELKKQLQSVAEKMPLQVEAVIKGMTGEVTFSAAKQMTVFTGTQTDLKALMTPAVYDKVANVTLTDAKKYLSEIELAQVTEKQYGSRTLLACKSQ